MWGGRQNPNSIPTTFSLSKHLSSSRRIGALALMATAGEGSYEVGGGGGGGKFRKRPFRRPQPTPYDRPPVAIRNPRNGWLSKVVDPASRLITASANRLFNSVFRKRLPPPALLPSPALLPPPGLVHFAIFLKCYFLVCLFPGVPLHSPLSFFFLLEKDFFFLFCFMRLLEWRNLGVLTPIFLILFLGFGNSDVLIDSVSFGNIIVV